MSPSLVTFHQNSPTSQTWRRRFTRVDARPLMRRHCYKERYNLPYLPEANVLTATYPSVLETLATVYIRDETIRLVTAHFRLFIFVTLDFRGQLFCYPPAIGLVAEALDLRRCESEPHRTNASSETLGQLLLKRIYIKRPHTEKRTSAVPPSRYPEAYLAKHLTDEFSFSDFNV